MSSKSRINDFDESLIDSIMNENDVECDLEYFNIDCKNNGKIEATWKYNDHDKIYNKTFTDNNAFDKYINDELFMQKELCRNKEHYQWNAPTPNQCSLIKKYTGVWYELITEDEKTPIKTHGFNIKTHDLSISKFPLLLDSTDSVKIQVSTVNPNQLVKINEKSNDIGIYNESTELIKFSNGVTWYRFISQINDYGDLIGSYVIGNNNIDLQNTFDLTNIIIMNSSMGSIGDRTHKFRLEYMTDKYGWTTSPTIYETMDSHMKVHYVNPINITTRYLKISPIDKSLINQTLYLIGKKRPNECINDVVDFTNIVSNVTFSSNNGNYPNPNNAIIDKIINPSNEIINPSNEGNNLSWYFNPITASSGNVYLQADFSGTYHIREIFIQSQPSSKNWTTKYRLSYYSDKDKKFIDIDNDFVGNCNDKFTKKHTLNIITNRIRLYPISWINKPSLKVGFTGDKKADLSVGGNITIDTSNKVYDEIILQNPSNITGIITKAKYPNIWVSEYKIIYRKIDNPLQHNNNPLQSKGINSQGNYHKEMITIPRIDGNRNDTDIMRYDLNINTDLIRVIPTKWVGKPIMNIGLVTV